METVISLAALVLLYLLWQRMLEVWDEWSGAVGRWRRGEPLRASDLRNAEFRAEQDRRQLRRQELKRQHEADCRIILDTRIRREFEDLGLAREIYAEVIAASGHRCAACGRQFSQRRRKPLLHVDHIRPRKLFPHLVYVRSNLQVLCRPCNVHKSDYDGDDWKEVVAARRRATAKKKRRERVKATRTRP